MKIITQLGVLFAVSLAGSLVASVLPIPFPSSVMAMLILFLLLLCRVIKLEQIDTVGDFLQNNMMILFIPAFVDILESGSLMKGFLPQIFVICIASTAITFVVTLYTTRLVIFLQNKCKGGGQDATSA